jgi:hypothetical protein
VHDTGGWGVPSRRGRGAHSMVGRGVGRGGRAKNLDAPENEDFPETTSL